ncbi:hypothetical protein DIPPA_09556 [Diplonema papillatum]|nr:hypothetical protein DIPPA_09556 [Diplonema papillatum]
MTLVVDQKLEPPAPNAKGWAAHPSDGAILYFPGNLLHGVLPATTRRDTSVQRLTLLVALWGTRDFEPPEDNAIGPQAALPPAEDCAWVRNMVQKGLVRNPGDAAAAETDLLPIARVWEPVPRPRKKSEEEELAVPAAIDQRFFMKHLDFKKVLLEDHCGAGDSEDEEDEEDDE